MKRDAQVERHTLKCADGHLLSILVHRNVERADQCSSILVMTPYRSQRYQEDGLFFSTAGFAMVVVDSRGCGASSGSFDPFEHDGEDVRQVIRWIAGQAWSNGRVGLYGGSYSGFVQWAACKEPVAGLRSMAPVASVYPGVDFPAVNGLMYLYASRWLAYVDQRAEDEMQYLDDDHWARILAGVKLSNPTALIVGASGQAATLQRWLASLGKCNWWQSFSPNEARMAELDIPMLFITGTYDDDQKGTLGYYQRLNEQQRKNSILVIGPWDHDGTRRPRACFGGLVHDSASCLDLLELHRQWYTFTLEGGAPPALCRAAVWYYMAGSERWYGCTSLEDISDRQLTLHCDANGGLVGQPVPRMSLSTVVAGPSSQIGNVMGHEPVYRACADLLELAGGVSFTTGLQAQPLPLCGVPSVTLYLQVAQRADVCVTLYALLPDRTALYLGASNRRVGADVCDQTQCWLFDSFHLICRELPQFSRLRIIVSLTDSALWLSDNHSQTQVELLHGGDFPCTLSLPLQAFPARSA